MNGENHCFQFTPMGIVPYGAPVPTQQQGDEPMPSVVHRLEPVEQTAAPAHAPLPAIAKPAKPDAKVTGRDILRMAKARARELRQQLAAVPALRRELEEMQRLIDAATTKRATVLRIRNGTHD